MSAYNRVRGVYATENRYTLNTILREEWGFEGYVQSDFWSTRSCAASLNAGLDLEMPDAKWLNEALVKEALHDTSLEIQTVDRALVRRFTQMFTYGHFEKPYAPTEIPAAEHGRVSRELGHDMAVLLKNDAGLLPLSTDIERVLIVGMDSFAGKACQGGGGSSKVDPLYTVDPLPGLRDVLADLGCAAQASLFQVERDHSNLDEAIEAANGADVLLIMAGLIATEGADMEAPVMSYRQSDMVAALLGHCAKTVVVLKNSSPVLMSWIDAADTVIEVWNQGAEDGHVVPELLWGVVNPSGKVPTTYARRVEDLLYHDNPVRYPGTDEGEGYPKMRYTEGLNVGYRWFQSQGIEPLFGFGYGLSYTTFELSDVALDVTSFDGKAPVTVSATLTNTGERAGAEVVQVYLGIPVEGQPPKRLVGFAKVRLEPGASAPVSIVVDPAATHHPFGVWDCNAHDFVAKPGDYTVYVGTSADDTPHALTVTVG